MGNVRAILLGLALLTGQAWAKEKALDLFEAGKYQETVLEAVQRLKATANPPAGEDRTKLIEAMAESQLRLKQYSAAVQSFTALQKSTTDLTQAGKYALTVRVIQKSSSGLYTPKTVASDATSKPAGISIIDPATREEAMKALYADERAAARPAMESAAKAEQLQKIAFAMDTLLTLGQMEMLVTGKTDETKELASPVINQGITLINTQLTKMDTRVEKIEENANDVTGTKAIKSKKGKTQKYEQTKAGLDPSESEDLKEILENCTKLTATIETFAKVPSNVDLAPIRAELTKVSTHANAVLTASYAPTPVGPAGAVPELKFKKK